MTKQLLMAAWMLYRRGRALAFSCIGRNPLGGGRHALTPAQEWASIRGLISTRAKPAKIVKQDAEGYVLWDTAMGLVWTPKGAGADFVQRVTVEMHSNVYDLTHRSGGGEFVVMDCGANVGFFSRFAFNSGATRVIAFEPSPDNAVCLRRNLAAEIESGRLLVIPKGVWDKDAVLSFSTVNVNNPGDHHIIEDGGGDVKIPVTSIDSVVSELNVSHLDYIKMDIEGAETHAVAGARKTMLRDRPQICIATEHTDDMFANAKAVIDEIHAINPAYEYVCTEAHPYKSPGHGLMLTPFSLLFR